MTNRNPFEWREFVQPFAHVQKRIPGQNGPAPVTIVFQEAAKPVAAQKDQAAIEKERAYNRAYKAKKYAEKTSAITRFHHAPHFNVQIASADDSRRTAAIKGRG